jgi:hypothetical protein
MQDNKIKRHEVDPAGGGTGIIGKIDMTAKTGSSLGRKIKAEDKAANVGTTTAGSNSTSPLIFREMCF